MAATSNPSHPSQASTEFTLRRTALISQISESLESVLTQINALNRGLEGIIEIGNEFASVEALWSQFEGVMGVNVNEEGDAGQEQGQEDDRGDGRNGDGREEVGAKNS